MVQLVFLACVLWATTKKRSSTFLRKKTAPPDKIVATPMYEKTDKPPTL